MSVPVEVKPGYKIDPTEFERLQAYGLSARQIADRLNVTVRTVVRWRRKMLLTAPARSEHASKPVTPERLEQARSLIDGGASLHEVQRTLGMRRETIRKYFPGAGWTSQQGSELGAMNRLLNQL